MQRSGELLHGIFWSGEAVGDCVWVEVVDAVAREGGCDGCGCGGGDGDDDVCARMSDGRPSRTASI